MQTKNSQKLLVTNTTILNYLIDHFTDNVSQSIKALEFVLRVR